MSESGIMSIDLSKRKDGSLKRVRLVFGPHYFVEVHTNDDDSVEFRLGANHNGFRADASKVDGELEKIIREIRERYPDTVVD